MPTTSIGESVTSYLSFAISFRASRERISAIRNRLDGRRTDSSTPLEAKRLLLHSELTITEIGYELGFEDRFYFSRLVR
jgi:hypothetical protein